MADRPTTERRRGWVLAAGLLAALAYLPALASQRGQLPADSKLYLALDPGRLLVDAAWSWDPKQFGGWVPHQLVGFLWPSGPFWWLGEAVGLPDWVTQRLWIGTLLAAAGIGALWCARRLGLGLAGAVVTALVYQLTPYLLPYVSRTSVMLLPWAGLPWLVGLTVLAARRGGWRWPALFALVVATVGGVNATALAMVAPAPLLWLLDATWRGELAARRAAAVAGRIGLLSLVCSLWWIIPLTVQSRFGADVLGYTETLEAVSFTSLGSEVLRGMGYWLAYVRDLLVPVTAATVVHQTAPGVMLAGLGLAAAGVAGLAVVRWTQRRFAALLVAAGTVLAVGAHPTWDPPPLTAPLADASRSAVALALRSSTRAIPLLLLGLGLGLGALVHASCRRRPATGVALAAGVAALAAVQLLPAWTRDLVDPYQSRPVTVAPWWEDLARSLDAGRPGSRVLMVPGVEFQSFRWGPVVDPPLPGLTDRELLTRDLVPLGSAPAMDLLYALDDRYQDGVAEPAALAPVARLLGATHVLAAPEVAYERFATPRPETTARWALGPVPGLGEAVTFGAAAPQDAAPQPVDPAGVADTALGSAVPPLVLRAVEDPGPSVSADTGEVLVVGSGAGVVDAAAAGVIDGRELLRYDAALDDAAAAGAVASARRILLTDSNRKQAHQWRGSQDVLGLTEDEGPAVLATDSADQRLPVFPTQAIDRQTLAEQRGGVRAVASAYGSPVRYLPEDRAWHAVDGDPSTAWRVGEKAEVLGERLRVEWDEPQAVSDLWVVQDQAPSTRWITELEVRTPDGTRTVALDERSRSLDGQPLGVDLPPSPWVELVVSGTSTGEQPSYFGDTPVGLAEVFVPGGPVADEVVTVPSLRAAPGPRTPLDVVLTRWRVDPQDRWRTRDPETTLVREVTLPDDRAFDASVDVRLDRRAGEEALATLLGIAPGARSSGFLTGTPASAGWAALDGDPATAWISPVDPVGAGASLTVPLDAPIDRLGLTVRTGDLLAVPTSLVLQHDGGVTTVTLPPPDPQGRIDVSFPEIASSSLTITVNGTDGRTAPDLRTREVTALPVAVAELDGPGLTPVPLPESVDTGCRADLLAVDGNGLGLRVQGRTADLLAGGAADVEVCGGPLPLAAGTHLVRSTTGSGLQVDRVVLRSGDDDRPASSPVPVTVTSSSRGSVQATIGPCPEGCWLVQSVGRNGGWHAAGPDGDLGAPEAVRGGMNGWWIPPTATAAEVTITWTPQRQVWVGLLASLAGVLACVVLVLVPWRRRVPVVTVDDAPALTSALGTDLLAGWRRWLATAVAGVAGALAIGPVWGVVAAAVVAVAALVRRPRLPALVGAAILLVAGGGYALQQYRYRRGPGFGWVTNVQEWHRPALLAVVLLVGSLPWWRERAAADDPEPVTSLPGAPPSDTPAADTPEPAALPPDAGEPVDPPPAMQAGPSGHDGA